MASKDDFETPEGDLVSPSQIEVWRDCQRKWAFHYIDKVEKESHPSALRGTEVHRVLEDWLKAGVVIDLDETVEIDDKPFKPGPIAAAMIKHLPAPGTCGTERHIFVRTPVAHYQGHVDWDLLKQEIPVIGDHKTTSNFKWAKTEEDLKKDPQANIYAASAMAETGADAVDLQWTYGKTVGAPTTKVVRLRLYRSEVERQFDHLDASAAEILIAKREAKPALEHNFNPGACGMYGGCPHVDTCNLSPIERLKAIMAKTSLAQKMLERKAALASGQPGGSPAPVAVAPVAAAAVAPVAAAPVAAPGINSPDVPAGVTTERVANANPAGSTVAPVPVAAAPIAAAPVAAVKKPRGRPPGSGKKSAAAAPVAAAPIANGQIVGHGTRVKGTAAAPAAPAGVSTQPYKEEGPIQIVDLKTYALFIDCLPVKGGLFIQTAEILEPLKAAVANAHNVPDYRLIDFSKGPAYLREALNRQLTAEPISGIGLILDTRTDLGRDTLETFSKHAGMIVRAF